MITGLTFAGLEAQAEKYMFDTIVPLTYTPSAPDSFGQVHDVPTPGTAYPGMVRPLTTMEQYANTRTGVELDARCWLPLRAKGVFTAADHLQQTHRRKALLTPPMTYEVVGDPEVGMSSIQLDLRKVTL